MADPNWKASGIDSFIESALGKNRISTVKDSKCMTCDNEDVKFDDMPEADKKEYRISGMCSDCQRSIFG